MTKPQCQTEKQWPGANSTPGLAAGRALLAIHLVLSPLLFSSQTAEAFEFPKVALLCLTALLLGGLGLSALAGRPALVREWARWPPDPVTLGVLLLLFSAVASTVWSLSPATSLRGSEHCPAGLVTMLAYGVLFFATRVLCPRVEEGRRLLAAVALAAPAVGAYAVVQACHADPLPSAQVAAVGTYVRPFATLGHPNFLGAYLVAALPMVVLLAGRALRQGRRGSALILGVGCGLVMGGVVVCLSRGAWVALAVSLLVLAAGWLKVARQRALWLVLPLLALLALSVAGMLGLGGSGLRTAMTQRVRALGDPAGRQFTWTASLHLLRDNPVLGCGLDTFGLAFPRERTAAAWESNWGTTPEKAHNEVLQVLATQGLLGGAAVLLLTVGLGLASLRAGRRATADERPLLLALRAGLIGFGVQSLFSFNVAACGTLFVIGAALLSRWGEAPAAGQEAEAETTPRGNGGLVLAALLAALVLLLGWLGAGVQDGWVGWAGAGAVLLVLGLTTGVVCRLEGPFRPLVAWPALSGAWSWGGAVRLAVWAGVAAVLAWGFWPILRASCACREGEERAVQHPRQAVASLEQAVALDAGNDAYWIRLALYAQEAADAARTTEERRAKLLLAGHAVERAAALVPASADHHGNRARVLAQLAREGLASSEQAFAEFDAALALDPANGDLYLDAGAAAAAQGDWQRAQNYVQKGLALFPHCGPLWAQRANLALHAQHLREAAGLLLRALQGEWNGNTAGWQTTEQALHRLEKVLRDREPPARGS